MVLLIIFTSLLGAYTLNFQKATLAWGREISKSGLLPSGLQDAITPKSQTLRNIILFLLIAAVIVCGFVLYPWYFAILCIVSTFILTGILMAVLPKANSDYFYRKIRQDLLKRQFKFEKIGDFERESAICDILSKLEKSAGGEHMY